MDLPNLEFLKDFKAILSDEKDELIRQQLGSFTDKHGINNTIRLEKSYFSFIDKLDSESVNLNSLYAHPFIINLLKASGKSRERDLRKLTESFSAFILTAGTANTPSHQNVRRLYSYNLMESLKDISSKDPSQWVATLRERLDTKKD